MNKYSPPSSHALKSLDFLMDSSITKAPLVPCIFGVRHESLQSMKYFALLSHKNTTMTALSQSEIPIMTLEAAQLLFEANQELSHNWFPVTVADSPSAAMDYLAITVQIAGSKIDLGRYRAVVWNTTYLLGTAMLEKSFQELKPIFQLPTMEALQELDRESMLESMRSATGLYKINKEDTE